MGRCIFCQKDRKLTEEHLFARSWLDRVMPSELPYLHTHDRIGEGAFSARWRHKDADLKVTGPCDPCNSGWMDRLDKRAERFLDPMVHGEAVRLDGAAQELVATWACKIAMVTDQFQATPSVVQSDRTYLFECCAPPPDWWIWLAATERTAEAHDGWTRPVRLLANGSDGYMATFGVNHLVAQTVVFPLRGAVRPDRTQNARVLVQIWPREYEEADWPPATALSRSALADFATAFSNDVNV